MLHTLLPQATSLTSDRSSARAPMPLAVHSAACTLAASTQVLCCCSQVVEGSTVIDMTGSEPKLVRMGKGNPSIFLQAEEAELGLA